MLQLVCHTSSAREGLSAGAAVHWMGKVWQERSKVSPAEFLWVEVRPTSAARQNSPLFRLLHLPSTLSNT